MPRRTTTNANKKRKFMYRRQLAILSVFVIAVRSVSKASKAPWVASASRWLSFESPPLNSSDTHPASTTSQTDNKTASDWPGKPVSTLQQDNADAMRLVRIGQGGPVDDARGFFQQHFDEFLQIYQKRPDQINICGIRISHSLALYAIAKRLQPQTIIESGINSGQSTYFFRRACPDAKIISLDPEPKPICGQPTRWIDNTNNEYLTGDKFTDFAQVDWKDRIDKGEIDPAKTLVFFDDHRGFRNRFTTLLQHGFRHVINEDNYLHGEGSTRLDKMGLAPKQMWRKPNDPETQWMFATTKYYAEFPPILPPSAARGPFPKKVQGGILHHTDNLKDMMEPLLRPESNEHDKLLFQRLATGLHLNTTMTDALSYQEFMSYCFLCYMELAVVPQSFRQAWV